MKLSLGNTDSFSFKPSKENLSFLYLIFSISILIKSYVHFDGYMTWDSGMFFRLAHNLNEGNGFFVTDFFVENGASFFASWPVGYPVLLFLFSKIVPLDFFWLSKIINILAVGGALYFLHRLFREHIITLCLLLFFASFLEVFSYSLSEGVFIFGLIWFCYEISTYANGDKTDFRLFKMFLATVLLFLTRYIGAVNIGILLLLAFSEIRKKNYSSAVKLLFAAIVCAMVISAYLFNNYQLTGYFTGMPRETSPQTSLELLREIAQALLLQFDFIFASAFTVTQSPTQKLAFYLSTLLISIGICVFFFRKIGKETSSTTPTHQYVLSGKIIFLVGILHTLSLILLRWFFYYGILGFRYFSPGILLSFVGVCILLLEQYNEQQRNIFVKMMFALAVISWFITVPIKTIIAASHSPRQNYVQHIAQLQQRYSLLPNNSLVGCAGAHLLYLRTDCQNAYPASKRHNARAETLDEFISRLKKSSAKHVFIEINHQLEGKEFDESIVEYMKQNTEGRLVKISTAK